MPVLSSVVSILLICRTDMVCMFVAYRFGSARAVRHSRFGVAAAARIKHHPHQAMRTRDRFLREPGCPASFRVLRA